MYKKYKSPYRSAAWYREAHNAHKERIARNRRVRYAANADTIREKDKERYQNNRSIIIAREAARVLNRDRKDPVFRAKRRAHTHFRNWIMTPRKTEAGENRYHERYEMTWRAYREAIKNKFSPGMTFDNHGTLWEFDHIVPIATFDLRDLIEIKKCFNINNIRPLLKQDNAARKRKYN